MERSRRPLTSCGKTVKGASSELSAHFFLMTFGTLISFFCIKKKRTQDRPQTGWEFECRFRVVWGPGYLRRRCRHAVRMGGSCLEVDPVISVHAPASPNWGGASWEGGVVDPI